MNVKVLPVPIPFRFPKMLQTEIELGTLVPTPPVFNRPGLYKVRSRVWVELGGVAYDLQSEVLREHLFTWELDRINAYERCSHRAFRRFAELLDELSPLMKPSITKVLQKEKEYWRYHLSSPWNPNATECDVRRRFLRFLKDRGISLKVKALPLP